MADRFAGEIHIGGTLRVPTWGWLALRRVTGKHLPQRSDKEKWTGSGVEKKAFSGKRQLALGVGLSIR